MELTVMQEGKPYYAKGGILTAPTIFGASGDRLLGGGEAGPEAILPLSALWEKLKLFLHSEKDDGNDSHGQGRAASVVSSILRRETRTLERKSTETEKRSVYEAGPQRGRGKTIIQKLEIKLDMNRLKDLQALFRLVDELMDAQNSTDEPEPA